MKKTINVNIAGAVFTLDEDAYKLLYDYLEALQAAFRKNDEGNEIVGDIEYRIAEILGEKVAAGHAVVTIADIENLISRIGNPDEIMESETDIKVGNEDIRVEEKVEVSAEPVAENRQTATPPPFRQGIKKKMYRDPQNSIIGGVCAGLAAYFGIDVVWVRIIFVILACIKGAGVIIYIVLWIAAPCAVTPYERMQMTGEDPTLHNIGKTVKDTFRSDNDEYNRSSGDTSGFSQFVRALVRIFSVFLLCVLIPVIVGLGIVAVCCIVVGGLLTPALFGFDAIMDVHNDIPLILTALWCGLSYIIVIGVPLLLLSLLILNNFRSNNSFLTSRSRWTWLAVWIIGLLMAGISTGMLASKEDTFREQCDIWNTRIERSGNMDDEEGVSEVTITSETDSTGEAKEATITVTKENGKEKKKTVKIEAK